MSENSTSTNGAMTVGEGSSADGVDWSIPSVKSVEKATADKKPLPDYIPEITNLADSKSNVTRKFEDSSYMHYQRFINQSARDELETYLDNADAKWRMSQLKGEKYKVDSTQKQNTLSQLPSGQYYQTCRLMTGAFQSIIFGDEQELPARYEAISNSNDYTEIEGERISKGQNAVLKDVWHKENWSSIIKESINYVVKNAHEVMCMEWEYETKTEIERLPGYYTKEGVAVEFDPANPPTDAYDSDGDLLPVDDNNFSIIIDPETQRPISYAFVEKTRVIKDNPVLDRKSLKDVYWDLDIDGFNNQTCVVVRGQKTLQSLMHKQKAGLYENVEKLGTSQLFTNESKDGSEVAEDQDDNADQDRDRCANGLFDIYHIYMYAPINKKGEWDEDAVPTLWEAVYAGDFGTSGADSGTDGKGKANGSVCLMLRQNPYHADEFPYKLIVSHPDDRGSLHMGFYTLLEANVEEQCITINQLVDNKTLAIKAPMIAEQGAFLGRDAVFRDANQLLWRAEGSSVDAIKKIEVPNMIQNFVAEMEWMQTDADNIIGTTDAFRGEFAGSRTTGTEYLGAKEQSLKPTLEHAKFIAWQYFSWILPRFMKLSRQFADPDKHVEVDGEIVYPAELYGDLETKVVSIEKYEADLSSRQVLNNALQSGAYDKSVPFMGQTGATEFWKNYYTAMKMPDVDKMLQGTTPNIEAKNQANADIQAIFNNPQFAMIDPNQLPKQGEMHDVHLEILVPKRELVAIQAKVAPQEERDYYNTILAALDMYIAQHEQLKQAEQAQALASAQAGGALSGQSDQPPAQGGEAAGDTLSGIEGQIAPGGF